jgi:NAD(P)-dependent dehydrogenase (short-subunit alcohol dehydrogenase family)
MPGPLLFIPGSTLDQNSHRDGRFARHRRRVAETFAAGTVNFLAGPHDGYVTGNVLTVDGGLTVVAPPFWFEFPEPDGDPSPNP